MISGRLALATLVVAACGVVHVHARAQCSWLTARCSSTTATEFVAPTGRTIASFDDAVGRFLYVEMSWANESQLVGYRGTGAEYITLEPDMLFPAPSDAYAQGIRRELEPHEIPTVVGYTRMPCQYIDTGLDDAPPFGDGIMKPTIGSACADGFRPGTIYYSLAEADPGDADSSSFGLRFQRGKWDLGPFCAASYFDFDGFHYFPYYPLAAYCIYSCCDPAHLDANNIEVVPQTQGRAPGCYEWAYPGAARECGGEICDNGVDDDWDAFADCSDTDCSSTSARCQDDGNICNGPEHCNDSGACASGPALDCGSDGCDPAFGCSCTREGDHRTCYDGPTSTRSVGRCRDGTQTCGVDGRWSSCADEVLPGGEICGNGVDEDCTGVDLTCPPCAGSASGTLDIWTCTADLRARQRCHGGMTQTETCPLGCVRRPFGSDDYCVMAGMDAGRPDAGSGACMSACAPGTAATCNDWHTGLIFCLDVDSDGCYQPAEIACAAGTVCAGGTCVPSSVMDAGSIDAGAGCVSECIYGPTAIPRCDADRRRYYDCEPVAGFPGCGRWAPPRSCAGSDMCFDGIGCATCGVPGERCCPSGLACSTSLQVCVGGWCRLCGGGGQPCCASGTSCVSGLACVGGVCTPTCAPTGPELCNGTDDDCNGLVDEGFDLSSDPMNCGACGTRCTGGADECYTGACRPHARPEDGSTCNNIDDDYDGVVDGQTVGCAAPCGAGSRTCIAGTWTSCTGPGFTSCTDFTTCSTVATCASCASTPTEICNGSDDNCDGRTDEGCVCISGTTRSCYGGPPGTADVGTCRSGVETCSTGTWRGCSGEVWPALETCNGADDDCDGIVDSGDPGGGGVCPTALAGACGFGVLRCQSGSIRCTTLVGPTSEFCNGADDDCNGSVDDALGTSRCGTGACRRTVANCIGGITQSCVPGTPAPAEICGNALDDNCDGAIDEGCLCTPGSAAPCYAGPASTRMVGVCRDGTQACNAAGTGYGSCLGSVLPAAETCNGRDDDCNGVVDDGLGSTTCGTGPCERTVANCVGGFLQMCSPWPPSPEVCRNATDEDCDGRLDNGCLRAVFAPTSTPGACFWRWDTDAPDAGHWYGYNSLDYSWSLATPFPRDVVRLNAPCFDPPAYSDGTHLEEPMGAERTRAEHWWACGLTTCGGGTAALPLPPYGMPSFALDGAPLTAPGGVIAGVIPAGSCVMALDPRGVFGETTFCTNSACADCSCGFACCTGPRNCEWDCRDGVDNDGDGLADCADPNCSYAVARPGDPASSGARCPWY